MPSFSYKNLRKPRPFWAKALGNTCVLAGSLTSLTSALAELGVWGTIVGTFIALGGLGFSEFYKAADEEFSKQEAAEITVEEKTTVTVKTTENDN